MDTTQQEIPYETNLSITHDNPYTYQFIVRNKNNLNP
jgi:hypothetical protein